MITKISNERKFTHLGFFYQDFSRKPPLPSEAKVGVVQLNRLQIRCKFVIVQKRGSKVGVKTCQSQRF